MLFVQHVDKKKEISKTNQRRKILTKMLYFIATKQFLIASNFDTGHLKNFLDVNPLPHMPILGSSNSAANENMMSKIWTNGLPLSD